MWGIFAKAPFNDLWQPEIIVVSVVLQLLYLSLAHGKLAYRLYGRRHLATTRQTLSFIVGCWLMYFSFAGPLDYLSDNYLYSAHMVQHMLEITIMTPLMLKGLPEGFYRKLWHLPGGIGKAVRVWAHPLVAGAVFNIVLSGFHTPYLYGLALENDNFHLFEHAVFFIISAFMWGPLLVRIDGVKELTHGQKLLYLLYNYNLGMPLAILQLMSGVPWYSLYVTAPRLIPWLTPLGDMQLGSILMLVFMGGAFLISGIRQYMGQSESIWYD
ncbi:cytochrome c oxidase assembly protein [Alicyclobacillus curvatus]|nr:cytochrome c oxidase assembly protein [Alicyclobacillus curvatus]